MGRRADPNVLKDEGAPKARGTPSPTLPQIFLAFLKLGATAFGGPAMAAHARAMAVLQRGWLTEEEFRDGVALCQKTEVRIYKYGDRKVSMLLRMFEKRIRGYRAMGYVRERYGSETKEENEAQVSKEE